MTTEDTRRDAMIMEPVGERELHIARTFRASPETLFDACARPDILKRWLTGPPEWTLAVCDVDLRPGGRFRYVWRAPDGREVGMGGAYLEIERPRRTVHTELFDEDWTGGETEVVTTFDDHGDGRTTLRYGIRYSSAAARDGAAATPMADGMAASFNALERILPTL
ncbi:SRPBCC domain-containing protein [Chthonobacter rhizosphaerae]|uniref:SRPBCC domain-containing protein n=1 Tax=Chthonobacter rhizosphaerae TaxID=2735553 RepID=UPI001FE790A9|nr:SRPBCC domain-containing protein [Chthonobacter rhizosphaerae]